LNPFIERALSLLLSVVLSDAVWCFSLRRSKQAHARLEAVYSAARPEVTHYLHSSTVTRQKKLDRDLSVPAEALVVAGGNPPQICERLHNQSRSAVLCFAQLIRSTANDRRAEKA
jgi:hypothetical protein